MCRARVPIGRGGGGGSYSGRVSLVLLLSNETGGEKNDDTAIGTGVNANVRVPFLM